MDSSIKRDGHIHSPYCPHGSNDSFNEYINEAIKKGIDEITFTEHIPMPENFMDPEFIKGVAPTEDEIELYFNDLIKLKEELKDKIKINIGLEVDYIDGYEDYIRKTLNKYGQILEDGILSTHFMKIDEEYYCFDCIEGFEGALKKLGSLEVLYDKYFETLIKSINSDLGKYKPKRIGHPTLIRIFNKKYPFEYKNTKLIDKVIDELKKNNYEIDFNVAGLRKEFCKEIYPSGYFYEAAKKNNIKMVYGSDAHFAKDLGSKYEI